MAIIKKLLYDGKTHDLYMNLKISEDDELSNFKQFFAYSLILDQFIEYINFALNHLELNDKGELISHKRGLLLPSKDDTFILFVQNDYSNYFSLLASYWDANIENNDYDVIKVAKSNLENYGMPGNYKMYYFNYSEFYLKTKLFEIEQHKYIIINYMLETFL